MTINTAHRPILGLNKAPILRSPDVFDRIFGRKTAMEKAEEAREQERQAAREKFWAEQQQIQSTAKPTIKETKMTVALYRSTASGAVEIVVQTNAQSLDVFISGLADALHGALSGGKEESQAVIAATLKNAFPVAFAIAGYKADKVSESKLLTCGFASPDASELLAQSHT